MTYFNEFGQARLGWRTGGGGITPSTLWNSIYSVYNADSVGSSSLKTSLYAAYNGESNANDSFGSNNGTAVGGLTYTAGKIGNAFNFNGTNSYVNMGDVMDIGLSSWSYSLWFKTGSVANSQTLFAKSYSGAAVGRFFATVTTGNELRFSLETTSGNVLIIRTGTIVPLSSWNHVVYVVDRTDKIKIYLNGSLITPIPVSGTNDLTSLSSTNFNNIYQFRIGSNTASDGTSATGLFSGQIDAFNIWNRVLTQSEITELYNSGNGAEYITDNFYKPTTNDALNTYNGTAQGGLTYGVGKVGTAFTLNGTNAYVSLPRTTNEFDFTGDFSINVWIKPTANSATYQIFQNFYGTTNTNRYGYNLYLQSGLVRFATYKGNTGVLSASVIAQAPTTIVGGTWYHIVITKTTSNAFKIYINGVLQTLTVVEGDLSLTPVYSSLGQVNIGSTFNNGVRSQYFNGQIESLNTWTRELSASEITELYNSGNGKQYPN